MNSIYFYSKSELPLQNSISMILHLTNSYKCYSINLHNNTSVFKMKKLKSSNNFLINLCIKLWLEFLLYVITIIFGQKLLEYLNCNFVWFIKYRCKGVKHEKFFQWMITYVVNITTVLKSMHWKVSSPNRANTQMLNSLSYKDILLLIWCIYA